MNSILEDLLTSGDVARLLNVSPSRASRLIKRGHDRQGLGVKFGRVWFIFRADVESIRPRPTAGRPPKEKVVLNELQKSHETCEQSPAIQNDQSTTGGGA